MNFRAVVLAVGLALFSVAVSGAESAIMGTWKQVLGKSKYQPGPAPTIPSTVRIEATEGGEKLSVEGIGADGQPASWSYTATYDGKPTRLQGHPTVTPQR
jgi:chitodextrinase